MVANAGLVLPATLACPNSSFYVVEKAIPFGVGAVIGSGVNVGLTTYVGREARKWLELDAVTE